MLTEATLADVRSWIAAAPEQQRTEYLAAFDDLQRTIAAQALAIHQLSMELRNRHVGQEAMEAVVSDAAFNAILGSLGEPRTTPFSLTQAQAACAALASEAERATDIAAILAGVARVARVFL